MKKYLVLLSLLLPLRMVSQNGGQFSETPSLKIEFSGQLPNMENIITVTNKVNCQADITLMYNGNRTKTVPSLAQDTFHVTLFQSCALKARTNPDCQTPNYGVVELNLCQILPLKLTYLEVRKVNQSEIEVIFEVSEISKISHLNFQISQDGLNFKTIDIMLGKDVTPNKRITKKIKIQ